MSTVSEVLAAQLHAPGFRIAEPGYEPDGVNQQLVRIHGMVEALERQVAEVTAQARAAEEAAARAEAHAPAPAPDDDELLAAVFEGQRRADDLLAAAEDRVVQLRRAADDRIAALLDDSEVRRLATAVDETRRRLDETRDALDRVEGDLWAATEATRRCRVVIGDRLAAAMADLMAMEHV